MSIENNLERIATALEVIANIKTNPLKFVEPDPVPTMAAPVLVASPAPPSPIAWKNDAYVAQAAPAAALAQVAAALATLPVAALSPLSALAETTLLPVAAPVAAPVAVASPTFTATFTNVPAATSTAPFADKAGLTAYTMGVYKELGAVKGAEIQNVLVGLGVSNINEVTPTMYGTYHAALEALKAA